VPSYVDDFINYSMAICEAPVSFHRWVAIWTLAAACGRRYHLPFHGHQLFPNLFLILVGPAGLVQKSTVAGIGVGLLKAAGLDNIYQDRLSRGYLGKRMAQLTKLLGSADLVLYAPELKTAFSDFVLREGLMEWLTRMWDCPEDMGNLLKESMEQDFGGTIANVCINFLGCSTPQWLVTGLRHDELGGGFSARTIYVHGNEPHTVMRYQKQAPTSSSVVHDRMIAHLQGICQGSGDFDLTPNAADAWFDMRQELLKRKDIDVRIRDYINRCHVHVLKLAALIALSSDESRIRQIHLCEAKSLLTSNEPSMLTALQGVAASKLDSVADEIYEIIQSHGGEVLSSIVTRTLSSRRRSIGREMRKQVIEMMTEADIIEVLEVQRVEGKRKATIYRIKRKEEDT